MGLFLDSQFYSIELHDNSCTVSHCFGYYCSVVSFQTMKCESSYFVFLFQDCFGYPGPLEFHMNLRISLAISTKELTVIGIEIAFLLNPLQLRDSFLGCIQCANKSIKGLCLISGAGSLISSICFLFFLRTSISLLTLLICFYMLSTFSIKALSILISIILNRWSDNANILAISDLVLKPILSFQTAFFSFSNVLLWWRLAMMSQVTGTAVSKPLVMWWWSVRRREIFYRIRSLFSSESVPLDSGLHKSSRFCLLVTWARMARGGWGWVPPLPQVRDVLVNSK